MITLFIFILLILSICLILSRCTKLSTVILVCVLALFLIIGNGLFPAILLKQLQMPFIGLPEPQWKEKNAIVLLGSGTVKIPTYKVSPSIMSYSRIYKTAELYFSCVRSKNKCEIIVSGGDALHTGKSEAMVYREALLNLNVNDSDIIVESYSMNTYKNAEYTSDILKEGQFDEVVLVTSGIHLKRSLLYFFHFGIHPNPILSDYIVPQFSKIPLGYNFALSDFVFHEYLGIARFYIYNFLGWNNLN